MSVSAPSHPAIQTTDDILDRAPMRMGRVSLIVRDLERTGRFYQEAIGLSLIAKEGRTLHLGVGGHTLLTLRHEPDAQPLLRQQAGLYHIAFLLPSRADLGAWLTHAARQGVRISGASDHLVSEAVYLSDPEGNGIEIYVDRPSAMWRRLEDIVQMGSERLDVQALMQASSRPWSGMPADSSVGHVHLQIGDLAAADAFYGKLFGFHTNGLLPSARFYSSGGYHHQLAGNTWQSGGAGARVSDSVGLAEVQLVVREAAEIASIHNRLIAAGSTVRADGKDLLVADPWGTMFRLSYVPH